MAPVRSGKKPSRSGGKITKKSTKRMGPSKPVKRISAAAKPKSAKRSHSMKPSGGVTMQCIVNSMKQEHPDMENKKARELVKIALNRGVETGQIAHRAGRWSLAVDNDVKVSVPEGRMLMTASVLKEYKKHIEDSHNEARKHLTDQLGEVETFITKMREGKEDRHLTDAMEMSMVNTVVQKYCNRREEVRVKAVRHLAHYFQEVDDVPRVMVGTMTTAKPVAVLRRRLPTDH